MKPLYWRGVDETLSKGLSSPEAPRITESILLPRATNEQPIETRYKGDLQERGDLRMELYPKGVIHIGWRLNDSDTCSLMKSLHFREVPEEEGNTKALEEEKEKN